MIDVVKIVICHFVIFKQKQPSGKERTLCLKAA